VFGINTSLSSFLGMVTSEPLSHENNELRAPMMSDSTVKTGNVWQSTDFIEHEPENPGAMKTIFNYATSLATGAASIGALMLSFPINLEKYNPTKEECDPFQTPVLLIHGFTGSSNNWLYHYYNLALTGKKNIFTINLGTAFQNMDSCADKVHQMVEEIKERTGRSDLKIIGHSMGGLVGIHYHQQYPKDVHVKDIITLGAPLDGTRVAVIGQPSPLAREMRHGSDFVKEKQALMEEDLGTRYLHMVSDCDWFIWPSYSAGAGRAPRTTIVHLDETGHVPFLFSPKVSEEIIARLDEYE